MNSPSPMPFTSQDPGDLVAVIPYLLGFHPGNSLVLIALTGTGSVCVSGVLHNDPGQVKLTTGAAHEMAHLLQDRGATAVAVVVVGCAETEAPGALPLRGFLDELKQSFERHGMPVIHASWADGTHAGDPWICYDNPGCWGSVPTAERAPLVTASIAAGMVAFNDIDELATTLQLDDEEQLAQRRILIGQVEDTLNGTTDRGATRQRYEAVRAVLDSLDDRDLQLPDETIAELAVALAHNDVRDLCLGLTNTEHAGKAEQLWRYLVTRTPGLYRANAAVLLAVSAYVRGDGVLAELALRIAETAHPALSLAHTLREAISAAMPPTVMREAIRHAAEGSEHFLYGADGA